MPRRPWVPVGVGKTETGAEEFASHLRAERIRACVVRERGLWVVRVSSRPLVFQRAVRLIRSQNLRVRDPRKRKK